MPDANPAVSLAEANARLLLRFADIWRASAEGYVRIASAAASTIAGQAARAAGGGGAAGPATEHQVGLVDALASAREGAMTSTLTAFQDWRADCAKALTEIMDPARTLASLPTMEIFRTTSRPAEPGAADKSGTAA